MKTAAIILAAVLLSAGAGVLYTATVADRSGTPADGIIYKQELTPGSYCHMKFPAISEETLATDHPVLKDPSDGDIIDYYGPCDEDPLGKDQVQEQRLDEYHRFGHDYED